MTLGRMTPDMELELTLELARASREPRAADRRRVLDAVRRSMRKASGSRALLHEDAREGSGVFVIPSKHGLLARAWRAPARRARAGSTQLLCVSVAMGALGFWLGSRAVADAGSRELLHWLAPTCR
jgi:hypothetical protein